MGVRNWLLRVLLFVPFFGLSAGAQVDEVLPEVDVHYKIAHDLRFTFQAKETREGGAPTQAEIGPTITFFLKPLVRLKKVTAFDLNDAKSRPSSSPSGTATCPRRTHHR